jgi:prefoldin subunit 5
MSEEFQRIQREVADLKKRAEELKLLKSDIDHFKKLLEKLAAPGFD